MKTYNLFMAAPEMYYENFNENNFLQKLDRSEWKFNKISITSQEQYNILLRTCPVVAPTVFMKKNIFDVVGHFDENFPYWEDRPMWLKLTRAGLKFYFLNAELAVYRS